MSTPTILDYPGARYLYNVQASVDAGEYASQDAFTGSTADADGAKGLVPAPAKGADIKLLCSDGSWKTLAELNISTGE